MTTEEKGVFIQIKNTIVGSKASVSFGKLSQLFCPLLLVQTCLQHCALDTRESCYTFALKELPKTEVMEQNCTKTVTLVCFTTACSV